MPWKCKHCGSHIIMGKLLDVFVGDIEYAGGDYVNDGAELYMFYCGDCYVEDEGIETIARWWED